MRGSVIRRAKRIRGETVKKSLPAVFSVILCASALAMPSAAAEGAAEGVRMCLSTVVPSLFTLMFVSVLLTECGVSGYISRLLSPVCSKLFGLSGCSGAAVLMSLLGGYPAGAKTVASMREKNMITEEEASVLPLFCFGAGPAFIIGAVGSMTSPRAALLLLLIQPLVIIICGVTVRLVTKRGESGKRYREELPGQRAVTPSAGGKSLSRSVSDSAGAAADALLKVCVFVVLFSALRSMLERSGISGAAENLLEALGAGKALARAALPVLTEVTAGCAYAARAGLPAVAFALGFGGLSVHMQVYGICRRLRIDPLLFTLMRLYQGAVSALLTAAFAALLPADAISAAAVPGEPVSILARLTSCCPAGSVTLLMMCVMWALFCSGPLKADG